MEDVRIEVELTRAEYVRGVRFYLRKSGVVGALSVSVLILMIPVAGFLIWLAGMTFVNTALLVLLAMTIGMGVFLYFVQPGRTFDRNPKLGERTVYTFSQENIGVRSDSVAGVVAWEFQRLWSGEEFYFLFQDKARYTMFPKRAFGGEEEMEAFEALVKAAVPDIKYRKTR